MRVNWEVQLFFVIFNRADIWVNWIAVLNIADEFCVTVELFSVDCSLLLDAYSEVWIAEGPVSCPT